jgi:hypothetical protein
MGRFLILSLLVVVCLIGGCDMYSSRRANQAPVKSISDPANFYAESIVRYYNTDSSSYITEQLHKVDDKSNSIIMTGNEPSGGFECSLKNGTFKITSYGDSVHSPRDYYTRSVAEVILAAISVSGKLYKEKYQTAGNEMIKIKGKWYHQISLDPEGWSQGRIKLYQSVNNLIVDLIKVEDKESGQIFTGRVYNYRWFEEIDQSLPMKIDIFNVSGHDSKQEMVAQVAYHLVTVH